jgi:hypothetical protein
MDKRYQEKIRKLLALSQSDNPHEAETAKRQAKALMKKHHIDSYDLDIVEVRAGVIPRKKIKDFESQLIHSISTISGAYCVLEEGLKEKNGRLDWYNTVVFIGLGPDAELAAYSFDVLYLQLLESRVDFKKQFGAKTRQQDQYSYGWVISATKKLVNVFGQRDRPEEVKQYHAKKSKGYEQSRARPTPINSEDESINYGAYGFSKGKDARLNNATTNQQEQQLRLGSIQ